MATVLITGVNGTIGRHLAHVLAGAGWSLVGLDQAAQPKDPHVPMQYISGDVRDAAVLRQAVQMQPDSVIHLAALVHVRDPDLTFSDYSSLNYRASEQLFHLAGTQGVKRVILASTVEVYGPVSSLVPINEATRCRPDTDYGRSKLLAEEALATAAERHGFSYAAMRLAPVYSSEFRLNLDKRLYLKAPTLGYYVGSGDYSIALCALPNIGHFVSQWLASKGAPSGAFNVADESAYPIKQVLELERQKGRCPYTLRLPYVPALTAISVFETGLRLLGRSSGMISVDNLRKLARSTVWDVQRAQAVAGRFPHNLNNTLGA